MTTESGREHPGALGESDRAMFARFGIEAGLLADAGVRRVTDAEAFGLYGIRFDGDKAGIIFPYLDPASRYRVTARLRRDNPERDSEGKLKNKYLSAYGDNRHLYFPPDAGPLVADLEVPVVFVEAEKSSLACTALAKRAGRRLLVIAAGGCWSWWGRIGIKVTANGGHEEERGPIPDLLRITWEGERLAIIAFDSNTKSNPKVRAARWAFAQTLVALGSRVFFAEVPGEGGVNGPDDLIEASGDEAVLALLDSAKPFAEQAEKDAEAAIAPLSKSCDLETRDWALGAISQVADIELRRVLSVRAARALAESKNAIEVDVSARAKSARQERDAAKELARQGRLSRINIEPAVLIEELYQFFKRRMHLRAGAALILALFALNTWTFELFETVPYLLVASPLPKCGKTRLLALLNAVCARPKAWVSASGAAMFRTVHLMRPTLLIDQMEKLATVDDTSRDIIAILESGYKKGASVPRMTGKNHDILVEFNTFGPKVLACVGKLKGALLDRCIVLELEPRPNGVKLISARLRAIATEAHRLREACEAHAIQRSDELVRLYEAEPSEGYWPELDDREQELFGPLLLHARVAGIESNALKVAKVSSGRKQDIQNQEQDFMLARELCEVLSALTADRFSSKVLLPKLEKREAWASRLAVAKNGRAAATIIGVFLRRFNLESRAHYESGTIYKRAEAIEKVSSYLPAKLGVRGVRDQVTWPESGACGAETSRETNSFDEKGVSSQAAENKGLDPQVTPLTPEIGDR